MHRLDLVLAIVDANGGTAEARTAVQKIGYFASLKAGLEGIRCKDCFYGPFSRGGGRHRGRARRPARERGSSLLADRVVHVRPRGRRAGDCRACEERVPGRVLRHRQDRRRLQGALRAVRPPARVRRKVALRAGAGGRRGRPHPRGDREAGGRLWAEPEGGRHKARRGPARRPVPAAGSGAGAQRSGKPVVGRRASESAWAGGQCDRRGSGRVPEGCAGGRGGRQEWRPARGGEGSRTDPGRNSKRGWTGGAQGAEPRTPAEALHGSAGARPAGRAKAPRPRVPPLAGQPAAVPPRDDARRLQGRPRAPSAGQPVTPNGCGTPASFTRRTGRAHAWP